MEGVVCIRGIVVEGAEHLLGHYAVAPQPVVQALLPCNKQDLHTNLHSQHKIHWMLPAEVSMPLATIANRWNHQDMSANQQQKTTSRDEGKQENEKKRSLEEAISSSTVLPHSLAYHQFAPRSCSRRCRAPARPLCSSTVAEVRALLTGSQQDLHTNLQHKIHLYVTQRNFHASHNQQLIDIWNQDRREPISSRQPHGERRGKKRTKRRGATMADRDRAQGERQIEQGSVGPTFWCSRSKTRWQKLMTVLGCTET